MLGRPPHMPTLTWAVPVVLAGLVALFGWDLAVFMHVSALFIALVFGVLARTAWALPRPSGAYSTAMVAAVFAVQAVIYAMLSFQGSTYPFDPDLLTDLDRAAGFLSLLSAVVINTCYAGVVLDRSAQQEAELALKAQKQRRVAELSERLAHLDRQVMVGVLAQHVVHQLNGPLEQMRRQIQWATEWLRQRTDTTSLFGNALDNLLYQTREMAATVDGIKAFLQPRSLTLGPMDMADAWDAALRLTSGMLARYGVDAHQARSQLRATTAPPVHAHPTYVTQVLVGMVQLLLARMKADGHDQMPAALRVAIDAGPQAMSCRVAIVPVRRTGRPPLSVTVAPAVAQLPPVLDASVDAWLPLVTRLGGRLQAEAPTESEGFGSLKLELPWASDHSAAAPEVTHG
jgi:signal transduction histidine kinase